MINSKRFVMCVLAMALVPYAPAWSQDFGRFVGAVKVEWIRSNQGDDREMKLLEDFSYVDAHGGTWKAPKGSVIDGASIPSSIWSLVGAPFVGDYREASVVHDYYCKTKSRTWKDVHRMFYYGTRAGGVSKVKAKIMYGAVYAFGPRWGSSASDCSSQCHTTTSWMPQVDEEAIKSLERWVELTDPSLEDIEARMDGVVFSGAHMPPAAKNRDDFHQAPLLQGIPKTQQ